MRTIVVVDRETDWPIEVPGVQVVLARQYLTDPSWSEQRGLRTFNLCRSYRYQSRGYYVSLLAVARRHRPFPGLMTVLDMKSPAVLREVDEELDRTIQQSLADLRSDRFELSVYFGRNVARRHDRLARAIFASFPAPLLRARFQRGERWRLTGLGPVPLREVPESHREFLHEAATEYFARPRYGTRSKKQARFDLAILFDPEEELAPSDTRTIKRMAKVAEQVGFAVEVIGKDDYGRVGEFDALFLRETTRVDHHTFRFAQRAERYGLAVIDDPESILRCTNKIFQHEAFTVRGIPTPRTWVTGNVDADEVERQVGFPCVVKVPDSAFSVGVAKCADADEFVRRAGQILETSELLLVQEFLPSDFDWRIGVLRGEALYACRYHMARGHWQIAKHSEGGRVRYGRTDTIALDEVPSRVLKTALRAAEAMGDGLYGVDLKQIGRRVVVMEVNDNPNLTIGDEDALLGDELYRRVMLELLRRVESRTSGGAS